MKDVNFIERMDNILNNAEFTTQVPNFLKVVFDRIIEKRKNEIEVETNYNLASISIEEDDLKNKYLEYLSENGHSLLILNDGKNGDTLLLVFCRLSVFKILLLFSFEITFYYNLKLNNSYL